MSTLLHSLDQWAEQAPTAAAQAWKSNGIDWTTLSSRELRSKVEAIACYLQSLGIGKEDVGVIYSYNSSAWVQLDLALMLVGASSAGLYVNASDRQIHYILDHSGAKILLVESLAALNKISHGKSVRECFPSLLKVIVVSPEGALPTGVVAWETVTAEQTGTSYSDFLAALDPQSRATLIYTSGTTGQPKAVSLSHANLLFAAESYRSTWEPPATGRLISFLPLAHIAERVASTGISLTNRYVVYFCSSPMTIASELKEVQPTILLCVPRLWDKLKEGAENRIDRLKPRAKQVFLWATSVSRRYQSLALRKEKVSFGLGVKWRIAEALVLKKLRFQLGLSEARRTVSGAAALSDATLDWYRGIGVRLIEGYALSETSGVLTCGIGNEETAKTVGIPYPEVQLRLAQDGEVETAGPHVFLGYFRDPEATASILQDGWLKTGDLAALDERGHLQILGRKREIIKTAEGKMISPLFLEGRLTASPLIDQAVVIGNERPHLVALLTIAEDAREKDITWVENPVLLSSIRQHLETLNCELASHERIKSYRVLNRPFAIENDEMTATMKLKRAVIEKRFHETIETMYERRTEL